MKPQEILLASAVIAVVGGAGAALATRALLATSERKATAHEPLPTTLVPAQESAAGLEEVQRAQRELLGRLEALERRLVVASNERTQAEPEPTSPVAGTTEEGRVAVRPRALEADPELTPEFVASVERALTRIQEAEEAEREKTRKELQAQRVEDRVTRLQQELGLTNRQASDVRTALLAQDEKREALFTSMREGTGDPSAMRDGFRTLRDDAHAELQRILTPEQYSAYQKTEESEFGRRFGDFGPPGGRPPERDFGRPR
jgi:hypothetical protein